MKINVVQSVLKANDLVAQENRIVFQKAGVLAVNIISSPGSGKTTFLEKTMAALKPEHPSIVIVGDLATTRDADRLAPHAEEATQINTGMSCHLYANQIAQSLGPQRCGPAREQEHWHPRPGQFLSTAHAWIMQAIHLI